MREHSQVGGSCADELDRYLADSRVTTEDPPLGWWITNRAMYPTLAVMAINFHTALGMFILHNYLHLCCTNIYL